jgi:hypothetical protein
MDRCHRTDTTVKPSRAKGPNQNIYAVNDIAFNKFGTFATMGWFAAGRATRLIAHVGGDGSFSFWDTDNKQRLKGAV